MSTYTYHKNKDGIIITGFEGTDDDVLEIPWEIEGIPVTAIGEEAFYRAGEAIEKIIVPDTVTRIYDNAFLAIPWMREIKLSENLVYLGENIVDMSLVEKLSIPKTVKEIRCPWSYNWLQIQVAEENPYYISIGEGLYEKRQDGLALAGVCRKEEISFYEVSPGTVAVLDNAFDENYYLKKILLPTGLIEISSFAFSGCDKLEDINLPEGLQRLGKEAFHSCQSLHRLHIPASLVQLGREVLQETYNWNRHNPGICDVTIAKENPVFYIEDGAVFQKGKEGKLTLLSYMKAKEESEERAVYQVPEGVTEIAPLAFLRSNLRCITLAESVDQIGRSAFWGCEKLETVEIYRDKVFLYIPQKPVFRKNNITEGFYHVKPASSPKTDAAVHFDYGMYDDAFETYSYKDEQCLMACCRLGYPVALSEEKQASYVEWLCRYLEEIVVEICKSNNSKAIEAMLEVGVLNRENIDTVIETMQQQEATELLAFVMEEKQTRFGNWEPDFSL